MSFYADLHIHSKHSRATSRDCDLENLSWWAQRKGIAVVGTGDFTHPVWFDELQHKLVPAEPGLFRLQPEIERAIAERLPVSCRRAPTRFMLSVEISTIYKKGDLTRKIHHLVYAPDLETADRFRRRLGQIGNIASDGRPILGLDSRHLLEIVLESGDGAYLVPAHIWTPWFAVLGSKSGFDVVDECYADLASHVFAVETGLSSDPPMNWRVSHLDRYRLMSNSDAHSPPMLGREACLFHSDLDYYAMRRALETGERYGGTIEFFPEEGKYHLDGHRKCGVRLDPTQTRALEGLCPVCGKPVTVGVMHRVEVLADRPEGAQPAHVDPFRSLVALPKIVGEIRGVGSASKDVAQHMAKLVDRFGPEFGILEQTPLEDLRRFGLPLVGEAIERLRRGQVIREAGFDGEYGVIRMFEPQELESKPTMASLFDGTDWAVPDPPPSSAPSPSPMVATTPKAARPRNADKPLGAQGQPTPPASPNLELSEKAPSSPVLANLDPEQREAAALTQGPLLIVAGPGTGKTRTLTHRFAHLIAEKNTPAEQCLALTFTRRAAEEMRERLATLVPGAVGRTTVTTFHGLGLQIVREQRGLLGLHRGFRLADEAERIALVQDLFGHAERAARRFLQDMSEAMRRDTAPEADHTRYRQALWERDRIDFDDLLALPVSLFKTHADVQAQYRDRFRWIAVDEYQDVDALQYQLLRLLAPADGNLCVIGDPDQAIYGFRGADVGFFLRFQQDFPTAQSVHLTRNYRSGSAIVAGAVQAIAPSTLVHDRVLQAIRTDEDAAHRIAIHEAASERAEAEFVVHSIERLIGGYSHFSIDSGRVEADDGANFSFSDFAVLYRTDAQSQALIEALHRSGIPFQKRSHDRLAERAEVQALLHALQASEIDETSSLRDRLAAAARKVQQEHPERDPVVAIDLLEPWVARYENDFESWLTEITLGAEVDTWDPRADRVSLLTLHAAKGLEFPVVFLVGCEDGLLPLRWRRTFDESAPEEVLHHEEERRLFFVGMTRAKSRLYLCHAKKRQWRGAVHDQSPSPFVRDIEDALLDRRGEPFTRAQGDRARAKKQLNLF